MKSTSNIAITYFFFFFLELKDKKIYLHCLFIVKKIAAINSVNGNIYPILFPQIEKNRIILEARFEIFVCFQKFEFLQHVSFTQANLQHIKV